MAVRESATILFTDLVGSTELSQSLSPGDADQVRRAHFATLRKAVASSEGTEVKNLGDGIMVAFSASSTAVSCAVAMQQAVEAHNRDSGHPLGLRVGISGGEVTKEAGTDGDDYFGDPVIEAARLCARAEGGQILASQFVQVMAGRRSSHAFRPVGELELKGLAEPLEAVEVGWEPLAEESGGSTVDEIPLPRRLGHRPGPGVVGRHLHLVTVEESYKRVASHQGREVVLIAGEAGQGKTTLAAEAARRAHAEGAIVLLGRCDEELGVPYAPFAEALNHYVSHAPEELLTAHVAAHGPELSRLTRALRSRVQGLAQPSEGADAETERYVLYAAVLGILAAACEERPVVLVLDDLQWADVASLQLLRHLVKEADPLQLLILGTYRDTELSPTHPLTETLGALRREPGVGRISLKGLDDDEVVRYLEAAAGHDLSKEGLELAHAVYGETDGNPFFVSEMLRHLTESGAVYQDEAGRWVIGDLSDVILPNSVKEVVATRVARLGEQATRVLSVAAVIGRDFDIEPLSRVTGREEDELLDLLDAARAVAVVREAPELPGRYTLLPRPGPAHLVPGAECHPAGPDPPPGGRGPRGYLRGPSGRPRRRAGPPLVPRHPAGGHPEGHLLLPPGRGAGARCPGSGGRRALLQPGSPAARPAPRPRPRPGGRPPTRPRHRPAPGRHAGLPGDAPRRGPPGPGPWRSRPSGQGRTWQQPGPLHRGGRGRRGESGGARVRPRNVSPGRQPRARRAPRHLVQRARLRAAGSAPRRRPTKPPRSPSAWGTPPPWST